MTVGGYLAVGVYSGVPCSVGGDCLPPEMSRYKQNGKFNLNQGVEKIAQKTKVKTLMDKLVLSILEQTAS